MVRTDQGGSVLGFVVIGVVMAALLVGGVFVMQRQNNPNPTPTPQQPTQQPAEQKPAEKPTEDKSKPQPAPQPAPQQNQQAPSQLPSNNASSHEMPQTGPVETLASAIAILFISGALISYVRSRRQLASL
jgi:outer membrane biosynthesis protein TonB